ncbi:DUF6171 family protein [Paenibacillus arenilitoris]|uniref:Uncharacterized protein n=1 Tax=Paenibacillus arenilitoris TaxID=2772299 RepID=A0A927CH68_9BACL|nr:DUF6171 family protein [Paenibacillus arenilitoris]MBD2867465.1 hypothetical protein [Paenibacillus arenilitoris]
MSGNGRCKGCGDDYRVTDEQIDRMLAAPMFASDICVPDEVYESRLRQCAGCPKLQFGTTCAVCGCFVRIAAKFKDRACPLPGDSRWAKLA